MADRFPLIVDSSGTPAIKEIVSGDVLDLTGTTIKAVSIDTTLSVTGNSTLGGDLTVTGDINGTLATAAQPNITSVGTLTGLTTTGDINFGDDDKAVFGAGSDLQIYHDGTDNHIIADTSNLNIQVVGGGTINLGDKFGNTLLQVNDNTDVKLFHGTTPAEKLATTSTGIDVTGTTETDNLTINGAQGTDGQVLTSTGSGVAWEDAAGGVNGIVSSADATAITINSSEQVGIGITNPAHTLSVYKAGDGQTPVRFNTGNNDVLDFYNDSEGWKLTSDANLVLKAKGTGHLRFAVTDSEKTILEIEDDGKIDITSTVSNDKSSFMDAGILAAAGTYTSPTTTNSAGGLLTISMVADNYEANNPLAGNLQAINTYQYIPHRQGASNSVIGNIGSTTRGTIHGTVAFSSVGYTITNNSNTAQLYYKIRHMTG